MNPCLYCHATTRQVKTGTNASGSVCWKCQHCRRKYTPEPNQQSYPETLRHQAVKLYLEGTNYRQIDRLLEVDHKTVMHWVKVYTGQLPFAPVPDDENNAELDELFAFVGERKTIVYLMMLVDRSTSCILDWAVATERPEALLQSLIDQAPQAAFYYSDLFALYRHLSYAPGHYTPMPEKVRRIGWKA
ncbi:MAG TPA: IS1 family transposase [Phototrophicaceae bacterium]|nr:IS1 family transposase [Phototrophicaceae bacterium]